MDFFFLFPPVGMADFVNQVKVIYAEVFWDTAPFAIDLLKLGLLPWYQNQPNTPTDTSQPICKATHEGHPALLRQGHSKALLEDRSLTAEDPGVTRG